VTLCGLPCLQLSFKMASQLWELQCSLWQKDAAMVSHVNRCDCTYHRLDAQHAASKHRPRLVTIISILRTQSTDPSTNVEKASRMMCSHNASLTAFGIGTRWLMRSRCWSNRLSSWNNSIRVNITHTHVIKYSCIWKDTF